MNLSLGGFATSSANPSARPVIQLAVKTIQTEQTQLVQTQAVWNVWDGNRILQDYNGKHVFTTVYEADAFVPLARLVWLEDKLTEAANDETVPTVDIAKLDQLKQVALQNIGKFDGLDLDQTSINQASNDEPSKHSKHQTYWYQNDHLGTPRELTSNRGDIAWEAVYQAWGMSEDKKNNVFPECKTKAVPEWVVTVEWQEVAQEINPIQLNAVEQSYLLQPHRFQGQIYDVETGLHYNRFRYYDPDAGRFISHDPIGVEGGENQFLYAKNPVEWVDPSGLKAQLGECDKEKFCYTSEELEKLSKQGKKPNRGSYEQAMNQAMGWLSKRGFKAEVVNTGKFKSIKGKPVGMMSSDQKAGFRLEFDGRSGAHINVFNGKEDGLHCFFNATSKTVTKLQNLFNLPSKPWRK